MAPPKRTINVEMYIFYSYIWRSCTIPCYGTRRQANLKSPRLDCNLWCILSLPARPFFCNLNGTGSPDDFFESPSKLNQYFMSTLHVPLVFKLLGCLVEDRCFYCFYENPDENPASFYVIGRFSPRSTFHLSLDAGKSAEIYIYTCPRWLWLPIVQSGSSYRFDGQNRRFRASEEGYWKDFF